jgi:uncharacterized delta-60 repeat protein
MATNRLFTFNNGPAIADALQYGNISISDYPISGYRWWPGPDEDLGYVITHDDTNPNMRTEGSRSATVSTNSIGFWRTSVKSNSAFLTMVNELLGQKFVDVNTATDWLLTNGYWTSYDGSQDGSLYSNNTSFAYGSIQNAVGGAIDDIEPQSDGKIIVGGAFNYFFYTGLTFSRDGLVRLNSDGSEDTSFYTNMVSTGNGLGFVSANSSVSKTKVQSDGKILVGGNFDSFNGNVRTSIIRLNSSGVEDTSFYSNLGTGFDQITGGCQIVSFNTQSDGKILIGGNFRRLNGNYREGIVRLNTDGTEDTSFYTNLSSWITNDNNVLSIRVQSDGKILLSGIFPTNNSIQGLYRVNSDGTLDTTFDSNLGTKFSSGIFDMDIQSDGKIVLGLSNITLFNGNPRKGVVRLNSDGTEDTTFYTNFTSSGDGFGITHSSAVSSITSVVFQPDGKILLSGIFDSLNGFSRPGQIIRLNSDGSEDLTFSPPTLTRNTSYPIIRDTHLSPNGILYVGGTFDTPNKGFYMSYAYN